MFPLHDEKRIKGRISLGVVILIIINTILFFYTLSNLNNFFDLFGFSSSKIFDGQIFTIVTYMFLHGNIIHLIGNMWFLWVFGESLEAKLGTLRFIAFYLLCGVGGAIIYALAMSDTSLMTIGASGAISGLLGGYLTLFPRNKIRAYVPPVFFVVVPAVIFIFIWFLIQIFSIGKIDTDVAYWGHIGGFISGILIIKAFKR